MGRQQHRRRKASAQRRDDDRGATSLPARLAQRRNQHERRAEKRERCRRQRERLEPTAHIDEREKTREGDRLHQGTRDEERRESAGARPPQAAPAV